MILTGSQSMNRRERSSDQAHFLPIRHFDRRRKCFNRQHISHYPLFMAFLTCKLEPVEARHSIHRLLRWNLTSPFCLTRWLYCNANGVLLCGFMKRHNVPCLFPWYMALPNLLANVLIGSDLLLTLTRSEVHIRNTYIFPSLSLSFRSTVWQHSRRIKLFGAFSWSLGVWLSSQPWSWLYISSCLTLPSKTFWTLSS